MVDKVHIQTLLDRHFDVQGTTHIQDDGSVNVEGSISLNKHPHVQELPVQFHEVTGHATFNRNKLRSLKGSPRIVGGDFNCSRNKLTTLVDGPEQVGAYYLCEHNQLTSLQGTPDQPLEGMSCSWNQLTSLDHAPPECTRSFWCMGNNLTTLVNLPRVMSGYINCSGNPLKNLNGWDYVTHAEFIVTYSEHLPLLRCIQSTKVVIKDPVPWQVQSILDKYVGQGKAGAIKCAVELVKAGYKRNAKW